MTKLLGHFLQEQQEPFALVERGCSRGINKSPNCSAFLKAVFGWNAFKLKGSHEDRGSSSDVRETQCLELRDRKKKGRGDEDTKELSPVSVLHQTLSYQHSPIHPKQGDSWHSKSSQCKLKRLKEVACDQYSVNMVALQQTKQLLIDCMKEMREKLEREKVNKIVGAEEEAWKLICENVFIWSQDSINGSYLPHLLSCDFLASQHEWNADFEHHKMEMSNELENAIFEDVINEIVIIFM